MSDVLLKALTLLAVSFVCLASSAACGKSGASAPAIDPSTSSCPTTGTRECREATDCGGSMHCTGGRCFANQAGCPCTEVNDCGSVAHCTQGTCYANTAGVPCTLATDCGPRAHCTVGTCYANQSGSPCSDQSDCGAGSSCVSGTCN